MFVRATLNEYGVPVKGRASIVSEVTAPDGAQSLLPLSEMDPGVFAAALTSTQPGIYRFRVLAAGNTFRGTAFTREQLLTGAVWRGGDRPPSEQAEADLCTILACLLNNKRTLAALRKCGFDARELQKCVRLCERQHGDPR